MSSGRYYFPEIVGNDLLSYVSRLSKSTLAEGEKIVQIFQKNHNLLYGKSPSQISLLMKQNNRSIFDPSPNSLAISNHQKESSVRMRKSSVDMSTPVKRNPTLPRKYLSADETKKDAPESETITIRQRRIFSPKNTSEEIEKPHVDETDIGAEVLVSFTTSESIGNLDAESKDPSFMPTIDETTAVDETFIIHNAFELAHNLTAADQESSHSTAEMDASLNADDCQAGIPLKVNIMPDIFKVNAKNPDNSGQTTEEPADGNTTMQDPLAVREESLQSPNLTADEKHIPSPVIQAKITYDNNAESDFQVSASPGENVGIAANLDDDNKIMDVSFRGNYTITQDSFELLVESLEIPNLTMDEKHTPSPVKQARITCNNATSKSEIHVFASPGENVGIAVIPDEGMKMKEVSFISNYTVMQDSHEIREESLKIPNLNTDEKHTPIPVKQTEITCDNAAKSEVQEKIGKAVNPDKYIKMEEVSFRDNYTIKQDSCEIHEERLENPNLTLDGEHSPNPVKQARITCDNAVKSEVQVSASPDETVGIAVNPDEDTKMTFVFFRGNKENISPIEKSKCIAISEEKRKSPCQRRNTLSLRGIPRMISSDGIDELDVSLSCESEESPSPKTSRIPSRNFRVGTKTEKDAGDNSPAKDSIQSDASDESKVERVPEIISRCTYSPSGNASYSSHNITEKSSPTGNKGSIPRKTISPSTSQSTSQSKSISPEAREHLMSSLKKTSISPETFLKRKSPQTDVDYTPENSISLSTKISPKVSKCQSSPLNKMSRNNTPESVTGTKSPTENRGNIRLKTISTTTKPSKAIISPKAHEHPINPSIRSPCKFIKPESPKTKIDLTLRKSISPSTKISPKISKCQFSPSDKKSCINIPEDATETSSLTGDKGNNTRKKVSPSTKQSESLISPKADKHRVSPSENISTNSPNSSTKRERPKTNIDYTPRKRISPSTKMSRKISTCQFSPSGKKSCTYTPEGETETSSLTGDEGFIRQLEIKAKMESPSTRHSETLISPKANGYQINPLEKKISTNSLNSSTKQESPKTNIDYTTRKRISPSTKISPKISICQFSPSDKKSSINISEGATETSSLSRDKDCITRKKVSPYTKHSKSPISPKAHEHRISPLEKKISSDSPNSSLKRASPKTNIDYTPRKRKSPSSRILKKISKCQSSTSDKIPCDTVSESASGSNSLFKVESYFPRLLLPSASSLGTETSLESQIDDSDPNELHWFKKKLTKLISMRDDCMNEILKSFSEFQRDLNFLFFYVKKIAYAVEKLPTEGEGYNREELDSLTTDLRAKAHKLIEKYNLWKTVGDSEVKIWIQYFEEIRCIISRNGTCNFSDVSREEYISFLHAYEKDLKSVWTKMDDMHIQEDARRSLLLNTTRDFEKLMKQFIKCLIIIGVIQHRSKTSNL